jgi:hypothetical protein
MIILPQPIAVPRAPSPLTQGLTLHLRLNDPAGTTLADASAVGNHGTAAGTVRQVYDPAFGAAREFDGTTGQVALPADPFPDPSAFTIAFWAQEPAGTPRTPVFRGLVGKQGDRFRKPGLWWYGANAGLQYDSYDPAGAKFGAVIPSFFQEMGKWVHVAWVKQGTTYRFYRNGVLVHTAPAPATVFTAPGPYWVGRVDSFWNGRLAAVRIYRRALAEAEIWSVMEDDRVVPFRESHPVGFELHGEKHEHALYIEEHPAAPGREVRLTVRNTAGRPVYLVAPAAGAAAGPGNHHFRLRFRRGVLSTGTLRGLKVVGAGWQASLPQDETDGVSVYLLGSGAATLNPGQAVELLLRPLAASPAGGPRTTRVELSTGRVAYEPGAAADEWITESRSQVVNVANQTGRREAPFHAGFAGSNTVLNLGRGVPENDLALRITNTLAPDAADPDRSAVTLAGPADGAPTRIVLSVDQEPAGVSAPWALGRATDLAAMTVEAPAGWTRADTSQGAVREWTFTPGATQLLRAGEFVELRLRGIVSSLPGGVATVRVRWLGLPGYWDGMAGVQVQKSPLHFMRPGSVGVGTNDPAGFHVALPEQGGFGGGNRPGVLISGGAQGNASVELRNNGTGTPYLDFALRAGVDYDARLRLIAPAKLMLEGSALGIGIDPQVPLHVAGRATVTGANLQLQLHRAAGQPTGNVVFLELLQDNRAGVHPSVRFHNFGQFWHRIEARPQGLFIKDGNEASDELRDLYAATAVLSGLRTSGNAVLGGLQASGTAMLGGLQTTGAAGIGTAPVAGVQLRVTAGASHLQLHRPVADPPANGNVVFMELLQENRAGVHPSLRFHNFGQFWHRIEARPQGLYIKTGDEASDELRDLYAGKAVLTGLETSGTAAVGQLQVTGSAALAGLRATGTAVLDALQTSGSAGIGTAPVAGVQLRVSAGSAHLQLHRPPTAPPANGNVVFLELLPDTPGPAVNPSLRFHQPNRFWHRIEGRAEGIFIKDGHEANDDLRDLYARAAVLKQLRVSAGSIHAQLVRPASQPAGNAVFLELLQEATSNAVHPSVRFHKANQFWHRIEGRPEGIFIKDGHEVNDELRDLYARTAVLQGLRIGATVIGEAELAWLKRQASGGGLIATF